MTNSDYSKLANEALDAFWSVVARSFPEATTGDLSIERDIALSMTATEAIAEWIANNVPPKPVSPDDRVP